MKTTRQMAAMAAVIGGAVMASAGVQAQTKPLEVWQPQQQQEPDPAKRVPQAQQPAPTAGTVTQSAPAPVSQSAAAPQPYTVGRPVPAAHERDRGGFFLGVQGGKGEVYDGIDQSALMVNAGYRWQAGAVTLVGIEVAGGQLDEEGEGAGYVGDIDYGSIGANARFNFGPTSPVYVLLRGGYWSAHDGYFGSVDGGYFGVGLGVDFNRRFNMSLTYTNHVYFQDYYWEGDDFYYDLNSADTLMLGAEVRF